MRRGKLIQLFHRFQIVLTAGAISSIWGLFVLPITSRTAFTRPTNIDWLQGSIRLKIGYLVAFFLCILGILYFVKMLRRNVQIFRYWFTYFLAYYLIMLVFFVLLYPGHWVGDEFNILQAVKVYDPYSWQHYFTNIYYTFCLFTIPTGVSIIFFQITIVSLIVGYIAARIKQLVAWKYAPWVVLGMFLLPPIIINNFYPLRLTLYSYLSVLFLLEVYRLHRGNYVIKNVTIYLTITTFIVTLLSFWRTEGMPYLLLYGYVIYRVSLPVRRKNPWKFALTIACCAAFIFSANSLVKSTYSSKYDITIFVNPLSQMIQHPLRGDKTPEKLSIIDRVISIDGLKSHASADEIPAFWIPGIVREKTYDANLPAAKKAFAYIVFHNPDLFLQAKAKTFLSTNGLTGSLPFTEGLLALDHFNIPQDSQTVEKFHASNYFSETINKPMKRAVTQILLLQSNGKMTPVAYIIWSVILPLLVLLFLVVMRLVKKEYFYGLLPTFVLLCAGIVFLGAPANYFMYYLPVYMNAYFMLVLYIFEHGERIKRHHE